MKLILDPKPRVGNGAVYSVEGRKGLIYFPASFFTEVPKEIDIAFDLAPAPVRKRAADLTPAEKAAAARERAAKLLAEADALEAALAPVAPVTEPEPEPEPVVPVTEPEPEPVAPVVPSPSSRRHGRK